MTDMELFQSGRLQEAIPALGAEVRDHPLDIKRRTFLFELLCFAGEYDRAAKHLDILGDASPAAKMGSLVYQCAIQAEKTRQTMFVDHSYPPPKAGATRSGTRNGISFNSFSDTDERFAGHLEVFVAGSYVWITLEQISSIEIPAPKRLRDLLWTPAIVRPTPAYRAMELGEVLLPVLSPLSWKHEDDSVKLGRSTVWDENSNSGAVPFGQKTFLIDEQEIPILELGKIEFSAIAGEIRAVSA